jgi:hypothetical protein
VQANIGLAVDRMAFSPRVLELHVEGTIPDSRARADIRATVVLAGASSVLIRHVVER